MTSTGGGKGLGGGIVNSIDGACYMYINRVLSIMWSSIIILVLCGYLACIFLTSCSGTCNTGQ